MKKALLLLVLPSLLLLACKRQHSADPAPATTSGVKKYAVNLDVSSGFTQQILSVNNQQRVLAVRSNAVAGSSTAYPTHLSYFVYDSNYNLVDQVVQDSTNTNFGIIKDSLAAGTYKVVIVAGQNYLYARAPDSSPGHVPVPAEFFYYYGGYYLWKDTFYSQFPLTITSSAVNQSIKLDRFVGKLEVNVEDAMPAGVSTIGITVDKQYGVYIYQTDSFDPNTPFTANQSVTVPASASGTTNYKIDQIIGTTSVPVTVNIVAYDANKKVLGQANVANVKFEKNKTTILSGKLFGSSNGFQVTANAAWDTGTTVHF